MFGGIGFIIDGNMACGVYQNFLIVRVGPDKHQQALTLPFTRPFDITGRAMRGWLMVEQDGIQADLDLENWVRQGVEYALTLPAK